jgi:hypothetical protein
VRSAGGFAAPDPWNENRRTDFTIEVYILVDEDPLKGVMTPIKPIRKDPWSWGVFGIKSEIDGQERMLPESLAELWRTQRIPAEALPRLLQQMQSSLKPRDYEPLRSKGIIWGTSVIALFLISVVLACAREFETIELLAVVLCAMLLPLLPAFIFKRRRARCRQQMEWALAHL